MMPKNNSESSVLQSLVNPANVPDHKVVLLLTYCARQQLLKSKDFISLKKKKKKPHPARCKKPNKSKQVAKFLRRGVLWDMWLLAEIWLWKTSGILITVLVSTDYLSEINWSKSTKMLTVVIYGSGDRESLFTFSDSEFSLSMHCLENKKSIQW